MIVCSTQLYSTITDVVDVYDPYSALGSRSSRQSDFGLVLQKSSKPKNAR